MKKIYLFIILFAFIALFSDKTARAQEESASLRVSPAIIDETARKNDLFKYEVEIENLSERSVNIYAKVEEVHQKEGSVSYEGPGTTERSESLASWILFRRAAIKIEPGESAAVPLKIEVANTASPGKRYAQIIFPYGSNQPDAYKKAERMIFPKISINFNVEENIVENAQLKFFKPRSNIIISEPVSFYFSIENNGNRPLKPEGSIYIYNKRGIEVADIDINSAKENIGIGEEKDYEAVWKKPSGLGKFKVKLDIEYGEKDRRDIEDTVFFWFFPYKWMIIFGSALFVLLVILTYLIFSKTYRHQHQAPFVENKKRKQDSHVLDLREK